MSDGQSLLIGRRNASTSGTILDQGPVTTTGTSAAFSANNNGKIGIAGTGAEIGISGSAGPLGVLGSGGLGGTGVRGSTGVDLPPTLPAGVAGTSGDDLGVHGISSALNSNGVLGTLGFNAPPTLPAGVAGTSAGLLGVHGISSANGTGVRGDSSGTGTGVLGTAGFGVVGIQGAGVDPRTITNFGVAGTSDIFPGVLGQSNSGFGVWGTSISGAGVRGVSSTGVGVQGLSDSDAVRGDSVAGIGVMGATARGSAAVKGVGNNIGVVGIQGGDVDTSNIGKFGVAGISDGFSGVLGQSNSLDGVRGVSSTGVGVHGLSDTGLAGQFDGPVTVHGDLLVSNVVFRVGDTAGAVQLNNGSAVVPNANVAGTSIIIATVQTPPGTNGPPGNIYVAAINPGTNFTLQSTNGNDNSTVGWIMVRLLLQA